MAKINVLSSEVFNLIAAGEVVERPASIVKELVENSIDAGAKNISIEIKNGGKSLIKISDNGCGIESQYALTAFLPHATSKISCANDLHSILTLGFRGEALASIASVSKIRLLTKTLDSELGTEIVIDENGTTEIQKGSPDGTYITVSDLFYNVPARRKFLKTDSSEENEITNLISRLILANPNIAFRYTADSEMKMYSDGKGLDSAVYAVYGKQALENSIQLNAENEKFVLSGFIGTESYSKPNRTYQTLIINGRYVTNTFISQAVATAYGGRLMMRQYPFWVLNLTVPNDFIDVNVHPNKLDVRFQDNNIIFKFVYNEVMKALKENRTTPEIRFEQFEDMSKKENSKEEREQSIEQNEEDILLQVKPYLQSDTGVEARRDDEQADEQGDVRRTENVVTFSKQPRDYEQINRGFSEPNIFSSYKKKPLSSISHEILEKQLKEENSEQSDHTAEDSLNTISKNTEQATIEKENEQSGIKEKESIRKEQLQAETPVQESLDIPEYRNLGVLFDTYILVQTGATFVVVDQHAAHERLLYDKLEEVFNSTDKYTQPLLLPYLFELNASERDYFEQNRAVFLDMGFDIEEFGQNTFKLSAVPAILTDMNIGEFIGHIFHNAKKSSDFFKEELMQRACKAAIKGGDSIPKQELDNLLAQIIKSEMPLLCPHGRPIAVRIKKETIERWFKRIV